MFTLIERYVNKMSIDDVRNFAIKKNINLSEDELIFTYNFIKKNYKEILSRPTMVDLDRYKDKYSLENFNKIKVLYKEYFSKYHNYF